MKKLIALIIIVHATQIEALTSNMTHRVMGSSPLFYKMIDYAKRQWSFEAEPIYTSLWNQEQVVSNIMLNGKQTLHFNQQGNGDLNPVWLNLMSNTPLADYNSQVTFTPSLSQSGMLLHWYDQFDNMFIDIRTALVQCKSEIAITEVGGNNGLNPGIVNAQQAFTQASWNYGKIGQANHVVGLDNIELRFGGVTQATSNASTYSLFITGFGIIEAPTGTGTKAEWLFEPQVGTNHWGLGFGFEALACGDDDLKFMVAGNYRYLTPAWETRSFDLRNNGQWSRYLGVQDTYGLPAAPATLSLPGINYFTQQAYIQGRSELNLYTRLAKQFRSSYFELSYNFFCLQAETIGTIKEITPGYGIYALTGPAGGSGGVTTSSKATINQDTTHLDAIGSPITITNDDFDRISAAAGTYASNMLAARFEIYHHNIVYGFGAAIDSGLSNNAISTWSVWAKFEYLFDNINSLDNDHAYSLPLYDYNNIIETIEDHTIEINNPEIPTNLTHTMEQEILEDTHMESFEFMEYDNENADNASDNNTDNNYQENPTIPHTIHIDQEELSTPDNDQLEHNLSNNIQGQLNNQPTINVPFEWIEEEEKKHTLTPNVETQEIIAIQLEELVEDNEDGTNP